MSSEGIDERARLIALDLIALYRDGAIAGADDPEARFYAVLMVLFEARYSGRGVEDIQERASCRRAGPGARLSP